MQKGRRGAWLAFVKSAMNEVPPPLVWQKRSISTRAGAVLHQDRDLGPDAQKAAMGIRQPHLMYSLAPWRPHRPPWHRSAQLSHTHTTHALKASCAALVGRGVSDSRVRPTARSAASNAAYITPAMPAGNVVHVAKSSGTWSSAATVDARGRVRWRRRASASNIASSSRATIAPGSRGARGGEAPEGVGRGAVGLRVAAVFMFTRAAFTWAAVMFAQPLALVRL